MSLLSILPDKLCEWFSDLNEFSGYSFCTQFPVNSKTTPLVKPVIVFGAKSIKVLDNTTDETGTIITDSRIANSDFTVGIHVPRSLGGTGCYNLFDSIIELLLFNTSFSISSVSSEEIEYIRNTDSLFLKASFTIRETLERDKSNSSVLTIDK